MPEYLTYGTQVRRRRMIRAANGGSTVPSRLIGMDVEMRLDAEHLEVDDKDRLIARLERLRVGRGRVAQRPAPHQWGSLVAG